MENILYQVTFFSEFIEMPSPKKSILKGIVQTENYQVNLREMFLYVKNFTGSLVSREVHMASLWDDFLLRG